MDDSNSSENSQEGGGAIITCDNGDAASRGAEPAIEDVWECFRTGVPKDIVRAVNMLKQWPHLINERYLQVDGTGYPLKSMLPFHMMVVVRAPLALFKEIRGAKLDERFLYNGFDGVALSYICEHYGNTRLDILEYICQQNSIFTIPNHDPPIVMALRSKRTLPQEEWPCLEMIQILVQYNPGCIIQQCRGMMPLEWSFCFESAPEIQEYLLEKYLDAIQKDTYANGGRENGDIRPNIELDISMGDDQSFDRQTANRVCRLFPYHRKLVIFCSKKLCLEGFLTLCCRVSERNSTGDILTVLDLRKLPNEYISYFEDVWDALRVLLATNNTLHHVSLSARRHAYGPDHSTKNGHCFDAIAEGLSLNEGTLQSLTLGSMEFPTFRTVLRLLSREVTLRSLVLNDVSLLCPLEDNDEIAFEDGKIAWQPSERLEKIELGVVRVKSAHLLRELFQKISALPSLMDISLSIVCERGISFDLTPAIIEILRRNHLRKLSIIPVATTTKKTPAEGCSIDLSRVCFESLQTNTSLESLRVTFQELDFANYRVVLDTLRLHNATLMNFRSRYLGGGTMPTMLEMKYWLLLNRHGRALARSSVSTVADLVDLLGKQSADMSDMEAFNIGFGLLRELPSKWSSV